MHCYVSLNSWSSIQINLKHVFPCDDILQLTISDKKKEQQQTIVIRFQTMSFVTYKVLKQSSL